MAGAPPFVRQRLARAGPALAGRVWPRLAIAWLAFAPALATALLATKAAAYADRLALISCGALVAEGTPRQVLTTATLGEHYGVSLRVIHDDEGGVAVIPVRRSPGHHDPEGF